MDRDQKEDQVRADPAPGEAGGESLEEVREELRSLGYLTDPIGGLLLPHGHAPATFLRATLQTSLRAGLLGGILLAVPFAVALGYLSRPHFQGLRDHLLLALYSAPLLLGAVFAGSILVDLLVKVLASRLGGRPGSGERLAGLMGAILAGASSSYLGLLWTRQAAPETDTVAAAAGILFIAGSGLLVGWLVRSGALVVLHATGRRLSRAGTGRGALSLIAVVAAAVGVLILGASGGLAPEQRSTRSMPEFTVRVVPGKVVVVGIDGVHEAWLRRVLSQGELPGLESLLGSSAGFDVRPTRNPVPPEAWTTIATGMPGDVHGLRSFDVHRLAGMRSPIFAAPAARDLLGSLFRLLSLAPRELAEQAPLSSMLRRSRAVWEIATLSGFPSAVINWWGTWPARAEVGTTISDRAYGSLSREIPPAAGEPPGSDLAEAIFPSGLQKRLAGSFREDSAAVEARLARALETAGRLSPALLRKLRDAYTIDGYHGDRALEILDRSGQRALFLYLPGLDILTGGGEPGTEKASGEGSSRGGLSSALEILSAQVVLLRQTEQLLDQVVSRLEPEDLLILIGDPGRYFRREQGEEARGFIYIYGGRVEETGLLGEVSALDLAPTFLAVAGLPQADDMPGRPLPHLEEWIRGPLGQGRVASYGDRPEPEWTDLEEDDEVLDRLRSLGYIQ